MAAQDVLATRLDEPSETFEEILSAVDVEAGKKIVDLEPARKRRLHELLPSANGDQDSW